LEFFTPADCPYPQLKKLAAEYMKNKIDKALFFVQGGDANGKAVRIFKSIGNPNLEFETSAEGMRLLGIWGYHIDIRDKLVMVKMVVDSSFRIVNAERSLKNTVEITIDREGDILKGPVDHYYPFRGRLSLLEDPNDVVSGWFTPCYPQN
jgi:hypothetical protein